VSCLQDCVKENWDEQEIPNNEPIQSGIENKVRFEKWEQRVQKQVKISSRDSKSDNGLRITYVLFAHFIQPVNLVDFIAGCFMLNEQRD
jgi:hypothetical protein